MEVARYLASQLAELPEARLLIGISGRAGAGKTTLAGKLGAALEADGVPTVCYSTDYRFRRDSQQRKARLAAKWRLGLEAYLQAINQFSWWDFDAIGRDLDRLLAGAALRLEDAYDQARGTKDLTLELPAMARGVVIVEGCILGGVSLLERFDRVLLLNTPEAICAKRVLDRDASRRSTSEIAARLLVTSYSENRFFKLLQERFADRLLACDADGRLGALPSYSEVDQLPVPIEPAASQPPARAVALVDLDGTLVRHERAPREDGEGLELLPGAVEQLQRLQGDDVALVLLTARPQALVSAALDRFAAAGVRFRQVLSDLPLGPLHLICDAAAGQPRPTITVLDPDVGLAGVELPLSPPSASS